MQAQRREVELGVEGPRNRKKPLGNMPRKRVPKTQRRDRTAKTEESAPNSGVCKEGKRGGNAVETGGGESVVPAIREGGEQGG